MASDTELLLLHFNDVYNLEPTKQEPVGGAARLASRIKEFAGQHPLVLFSGDCFSPSMLSTLTKARKHHQGSSICATAWLSSWMSELPPRARWPPAAAPRSHLAHAPAARCRRRVPVLLLTLVFNPTVAGAGAGAQGKQMVEVLNAMGVQASAVGAQASQGSCWCQRCASQRAHV